MTQLEFEALLKRDRYQVFLFACPATLPFFFATHPWFVVNKKGEISRWEIFWRPQDTLFSWGHLHKNFYPPTQGIDKYYFSHTHFWKHSRVIGVVEGEEGSIAQKMAGLIESSPETYPYCNHYKLRGGPNSNTYAQWVIGQFPDCGLKLPWNAFGRAFGSQMHS